NSGAAWDAQTVASDSIQLSQLSGSAEYFLFGGDGWCYCVVQESSTSYRSLLFGVITKTCTFTGGAFLSDAAPTTYVLADIDADTNIWKASLYSSGANTVRTFDKATTRNLDIYSPIAFNGVTPLY